MFDLVIAKYKEDISWAEQLNFKKFIYNKNDEPFPNSIQLKNIGREAHTWAYHIVKNYNNLDEYTIFVQGDPFYHFENFMEIAKKLPESLDQLNKVDDGLYSLADINQPEDLDFLKNRNVHPDKVLKLISSKEQNKTLFPFAWGAQHIVHRNNILCKSIDFWQKLVEIHDTAIHWPWSIERCWFDIFGSKTFNNKLFF